MVNPRKAGAKVFTAFIISTLLAGILPTTAIAGTDCRVIIDVADGFSVEHVLAVSAIPAAPLSGDPAEAAGAPEPAEADAIIRYPIPVSPGWNLISIPLVLNSTDVQSALDDCGGSTAWDIVKWYDPQTPADPWKSFRVNGTANDLSAVDNGMGLWVNITDAGDGALTVEGAPPEPASVSLHAGWNLVGFPTLEPKAAADALAGVAYDSIQGFASVSPYITDVLPTETMFPGNGYWVHATSDSLWSPGDATPPSFGGIVSAINMGTGGEVALSWSEAADPSYPITYNVYMAAVPGGQDFASPGFMTQDAGIQISGLTDGQPYYFVVRAEDSAGNEDANTVQGTAVPTQPTLVHPQVVSTMPSAGSIGVPIGQSITITFSESIEAASFAFSCSPDPGAWSAAWSATAQPNDTVTLIHADMDYGTGYTFTVSAAQDLEGNPLAAGPAENPWHFTTQAAPDTAGPVASEVSATPDPVPQGSMLTLTAYVSDAATGDSPVAAAEWSSGAIAAAAGSGNAMGATDGSFDSSAEAVGADIDTSGWPAGGIALWVRGCDAWGNWGSAVSTSVAVDLVDATGPQIIAAVPAGLSTGVGTAQAIVVTFSEGIEPSSFSFSCTPDPGGWALAWGAYGFADDTVTITHSDFAYATTYVFAVAAAADPAGNQLAPGDLPNPWAFTTAGAPDAIGPNMTAAAPASGEAEVAASEPIVITFSEGIDPATFAYACEPDPGGWSASWSAAAYENDRVTLTHADFAYGTEHTVTVTAAEDMSGNPLAAGPAPNPWSFTTVVAPDTVPPQVACNMPADGAADVLVSSDVEVNFTEAMDQARTQGAFSISPAVDGTFYWNASSAMAFHPAANLSHSTAYTVTILVAATDLAGNTLDGNRDGVMGPDSEDSWTFTFMTEPDTKGPVVTRIAASPSSFPAGIIFALSAGVSDAATGNSDIAAVEWSRGASAAAAGTGTAMLALDGSFDAPAENVDSEISSSGWPTGPNTLWVRGMDAWNNWGDAVPTSVDVTAPDTVPPQVMSNTPANGATGVLLTANIVVLFNEAMNKTSTQGAFSTKPVVAGDFSWNAGGEIMTFNPTTNLAASTKYTVTISTAATDLAGNTLDGNRNGKEDPEKRDRWVFSFTTGTGQDITPPMILATTPGSSATGVAPAQSVVVTFSESISTTTFMFTCTPDPGGWDIAWSSIDYENDRVTLAHAGFSYSTTYTFWVTASEDPAGNALAHGAIANPWIFTTLKNPDVTGPVAYGACAEPAPATEGGSLTLIATISDATTGNSNVAMAEWSHGSVASAAGFGTAMMASDGSYNSPTESVIAHISTEGWTEGASTLWIRARDSVNNWGNAFPATVTVIPGIGRYAVCVGINTYLYQSSLVYCIQDANECWNNLCDAGYSTAFLTDGSATRANVITALDLMGGNEGAGDYTAFTFSGHGGTSDGICFICPSDGYYFEDMITEDELGAIFAGYQSTHQLIFFDSCDSGGMAPLGSAGRLCMMAAAADQSSWDGQSDINNGVWTYYFWESGYRKGGAGSGALEAVFAYAGPLATDYVQAYYGVTMTPQISDGYLGAFYL